MKEPEKEAIKIRDKFLNHGIKALGGEKLMYDDAKQCALIHVSLMIEEYDHEDHDSDRWDHWVKIKEFINKIQ